MTAAALVSDLTAYLESLVQRAVDEALERVAVEVRAAARGMLRAAPATAVVPARAPRPEPTPAPEPAPELVRYVPGTDHPELDEVDDEPEPEPELAVPVPAPARASTKGLPVVCTVCRLPGHNARRHKGQPAPIAPLPRGDVPAAPPREPIRLRPTTAAIAAAKERLAARAAREAAHEASERAKPIGRGDRPPPAEPAPVPIVARLPTPIATFTFDTTRPAVRAIAKYQDTDR